MILRKLLLCMVAALALTSSARAQTFSGFPDPGQLQIGQGPNALPQWQTSVGPLTIQPNGVISVNVGASPNLTGLLSMANGGLNANLRPNPGGLIYSTAVGGAVLPPPVTQGAMLQSGIGPLFTPQWSTAIFAGNFANSSLLFANGANNVQGLAPCANGLLNYSGSSVPSCATQPGLAATAAPSTPAAGLNSIWVDSTDNRLHDKNPSGVIGTTVVASSAPANQFATGVSSAGVASYAQPTVSNLANVNAGTILSNNTSGSGPVVAATQPALALTTAPSTPGAGFETFWSDSTDKRFHDKNDAGTIGTTVVASTAAAHQFANSLSAAGVIGYAQPAVGDLSGLPVTLAQGGTSQTTANAARQSSGLNIFGDQGSGYGNTNQTLANTDRFAYTTAAFTASRTWTLPAANVTGAPYAVLVADMAGGVTATNTLVISRAGADTINGGTTVTISSANGGYLFQSDGSSKWTAQALGSAAASGVSTVGGVSGAIGVTNGLDMTGSSIEITAARRTLPTTSQVRAASHNGGFGANSSGTYTTPANALYVEVWMVGGGGGGAGGGSGSPGAGGTGGNTCWNTSGAACTTPVFQAGGGGGGTNQTSGGSGGTVSGSSTCNDSAPGGTGGQSTTSVSDAAGGNGGGSWYAGGGAGGLQLVTGSPGAADTGSGGGGGGTNAASTNVGTGGGAGAFCHFILGTPNATYTYAVGAAGSAGAAGTNGGAGAAGASGQIFVVEHYGS